MLLTITLFRIGLICHFTWRTRKSLILRSFRASNCHRCVRKRLPQSTATKNSQSINSTRTFIKVNIFTTLYSTMMRMTHKFSLYHRCMERGECFLISPNGSITFSNFVAIVHCREILGRRKHRCPVSNYLVQPAARGNWKVCVHQNNWPVEKCPIRISITAQMF